MLLGSYDLLADDPSGFFRLAVLIAFGGQIFGQIPGTDGKLIDPISFQWISPAALVVGVCVGLVGCKIFYRKESQ